MKLPRHKTKVVCTIGPASRSEPTLEKLIRAGMNVARLNAAHGTLKEHLETIRCIRSVATRLGQPIGLMMDLPGPKIRIGKLQKEPLVFKTGDVTVLTNRAVAGTARLIPVEYPELPRSVSPGDVVFLNDGLIQLRVQKVSESEVSCRVMVGGPLQSHKGVHIPGARLAKSAVTDKDLSLVRFGLRHGVDLFAVSFVGGADDIVKLKEFARRRGRRIRVIAKIERAEAVRNINEILEAADAIMIARGDLGVQIPLEQVPAVQKRLVFQANLAGRPVITATQMLESMTENTRPTRAEVTDVANAIWDGTDAVMLSEETAIGKYPVETVRMVARIAVASESPRHDPRSSSHLIDYFRDRRTENRPTIEHVLSLSVVEAVHEMRTRFVLAPTRSGSTPQLISRFKPDCWILAFTTNEAVHRFLALSYGVYPILMQKEPRDWDGAILNLLRRSRLAKRGDRVVLTRGTSPAQVRGADSLRMITVT